MFRNIVNRKTTLKFYTMKKVNLFYLLSAILFGAMLVFASCTKEGPAGADGADGADGEDGINGSDGTTTCVECHDDSQVMFAKSNQWSASIHATGGNFERNGEDIVHLVTLARVS